jgi:hypothetical protein
MTRVFKSIRSSTGWRGAELTMARLGRDIDIVVSGLPTCGSLRVIVGNRDPRAVL